MRKNLSTDFSAQEETDQNGEEPLLPAGRGAGIMQQMSGYVSGKPIRMGCQANHDDDDESQHTIKRR